MTTNASPECYVINNRGHRMSAIPAKVIAETASTITVELLGTTSAVDGKPRTQVFNKSKVYGESRWHDPRANANANEHWQGSIEARGERSFYHPDRLTFAVAAVEKRLAEEQARQDHNRKCNEVWDRLQKLFSDNRSGYGNFNQSPEFVAKIEALSAILG